MIQFRSFAFAIALLPLLPVSLPSAEPRTMQAVKNGYRMILRTAVGQVSLPDEPERKRQTYFLNLPLVGREPVQYFGGPDGGRFKAVKFESMRIPDPKEGERDVSELTCIEVATNRKIVLVMGKELNLADAP